MFVKLEVLENSNFKKLVLLLAVGGGLLSQHNPESSHAHHSHHNTPNYITCKRPKITHRNYLKY